MSVLAAKRKETGLEVLLNASKLRKELAGLVIRNFGLKQKKVHAKRKDGTLKELGEIAIEQAESKADYKAYLRFISRQGPRILDALSDMTKYITMANSIYPNYAFECDQKREYQNAAIGMCFVILEELQFLAEVVPIDINKLAESTRMIDLEIKLLKGWRSHGNKIRQSLKKKELVEPPKIQGVCAELK